MLNVLSYTRMKKQLRFMRRHCGRVVKAMDLKSIGFSRAGSNPANVVFLLFNSNNDRKIKQKQPASKDNRAK